jgi:RNase P/RNase MRP subunit p30
MFFIGKRNSNKKDIIFIKEISKLDDINKRESESYEAVLLKTNNPELLRRMIDKAANYFDIYVLGVSDRINRVALEHKKVRALVSPEFERAFDYTHYRNSGLNQVLCKIARDNNKIIIENFSEFLKKEKKDRAILLGRILQNSMLCKKYNVKFLVSVFAKNEQDFIACQKLEEFKKILI